MIHRTIRWAARRLLPRVPGGGDVGQQVALNSLEFCPKTVIKGFLNGFFPMPDGEGQVQWRCPPDRAVIPIDGFHVPKNLRRLVRQQKFEIRINTAFDEVIRGCSDRDSTWITDQIVEVYRELHERRIVHTVEAWQDNQLVGGLYGTQIGQYFATESQFHLVRDAGKIAFIYVAEILRTGGFVLHDVQFRTPYLEQFGVTVLPGREFRDHLTDAVLAPARFELPHDDAVIEAVSSRQVATTS